MLTQVADEKHLSIPLEGLDFSNPSKRAYGDIQRGKYVGINDVGGVACDYRAFIQQNADWQLWIEHGKSPLPRRIVIIHRTFRRTCSGRQFYRAARAKVARFFWGFDSANWRFNSNTAGIIVSAQST